MSMRLVAKSASRRVLSPATRFTTSRTFASTAFRQAGKEDALHKEGRSEEIEHHKQDSLKKVKEGSAEWKDALASNSESIVKADRGELDASNETMEKLQKESEKVLKNKK
ncbi:putative mitochondrial carrier protein pet8 [Venturia nashicola]|uniref:Putative mitochondrial carrier protein pet8 n=1 Tax=Venturia nashicola TaxID=86259 RepID=A0A4Z1P8U3_9PEZI|nr:putative mitochondrial carrier protein pet8 [Venturia nashicola]TLD34453.1 putative mitochondrial carrier protein pet8 [Venturia nashicola]